MNSRTLKLLTASTAFIAVASAGNAAVNTYTSNSTVPVTTSGTTGLNFSGTASVSVTTANAAVEVSGTVGSPSTQILQVSSTAALRNTQATSGTIEIMGNGNVSGLTINNSGTIANLGAGPAINGAAIQANGSAIAMVVNNSGTISGSIASGANQITYSGLTNSFLNGNITTTNTGTTTNGDAVSVVGGRISGTISLGAGDNALTVSNSTFTGGYVGGAGADTVSIKDNSTFTGDIATAAGADGITVSNSRVNGNITSGNGITTMTLTNATVSGTITDSQAADGDILTLNGQNTFTTLGNIAGFETVNVNTNTVLNNTLGGVTTALNVAAAKTLTVNQNVTATGAAITNNGTLNIAAGKFVTGSTYSGPTGSILGIGLASSNTTTGMGQLILSGGAVAAGTSVTINVGATSGYIASGTQYVIVDGAAGTANVSLTNPNTGLYRFSTSTASGDVTLRVGRVSASDVATGSDAKAVGAVLDNISNSAVGALATLQGQVGAQTTAEGVQNVLDSLTPSIDGAGMASVNITVDTGNQISNRLASIRSTSGVATGDPMASKHMWLQGFGSTVSQDNHGGNAGYDANAGGVSIGVDTDTMYEGMTTGLAFSYAHGTVDSNSANNASTDIDSYVGTLYGSRVLDNGIFVNGQAGLGYNNYDMERTVIGVGKATGDTNGWQGTAKAEAGKDYAAGGFTLTPLASLQYTYLDMDSYTETGAGGASLRVNPESLSTLDAGAGGQIAYAIPLTDGGTLKPSAHAKYIYRMGDTEMGSTNSFTGGGGSFNTSGVKADRSSVNLGAGLLLTTIGGTDLSLNYDADIRSNLTGHTGQLKARWAF